MSKLELSEQIIDTPIPNLDWARELRAAAVASGYQGIELEVGHELADDLIVPLSEYDIASRSYYSRQNITGAPIPGVRPEVLARKDVAERLAQANEFLRSADFITELCGGQVELFVDDGLRSLGLHREVYDVRYPEYLRGLHADWPEKAILAERDQLVTVPSPDAPKASGGAVDVKLQHVDSADGYIGYGRDHKNKDSLKPEYYENNEGPEGSDAFRLHRRIVFNTLGAVGLVNSGEVIWGFGRGTKMAAAVSAAVMPDGLILPAYYAAVEGAPEFETQ